MLLIAVTHDAPGVEFSVSAKVSIRLRLKSVAVLGMGGARQLAVALQATRSIASLPG